MKKRKAHAELVAAINNDLPLLMHGSGDVHMNEVDPASTSLLADLTASYISNLVTAAVDAHDILTDGSGVAPPRTTKNSTNKSKSVEKNKTLNDWDWDLSLPSNKKQKKQILDSNDTGNDPKTVKEENWIGALGIDVHASTRRPKPSSSIGTQCFIFPICHDAALYGRVLEVQAARRKIAPVIVDQIWWDMIKEEGGEGADWPIENSFLPVHK